MSCQLYLITPPRLSPELVKDLRAALEAGEIAAVQIRLKDHNRDEIRAAAPELVALIQSFGAAAILNDDAELAAELGCDGVHIGQQDGRVKDARAIMGKDRSVGVTCHDSKHLAMVAGEAGADYVAFGAFYPTETKQAPTQADPSVLRWWVELFELPAVAIGGITVDNAAPLLEAGADFLAVSSGVWQHPDGPAAAVKAFNALMADADS
ncbi:MAG: thiamine phosphate synthase [Maricaulis sp.]|uniref:thiamine phosphate synthase n=1 Tax=Maricaulis sp. TaxID=1486257 RepID=UPI00261012C8|nr:thiamine phosphate synthase [Maricaulis sp.]MDM7985527.1 thiamine phosphate synthase [Maricaulis sp.]